MADSVTDISRWKALTARILGRTCCKNCPAIANDILCVAEGLKPCFLFDHALLSSQTMKTFLTECVSHGLIPPDKLGIMVACEDLLIYNKTVTMHLLSGPTPMLIDVTNRSKNPRILDNLQSTDILSAISEQVKKALKASDLTEDISVYTINTDDINITTLFGYLLGYPCVYWFDTNDQTENCLGMEPLQVFTVSTNLQSTPHVAYSFSVPSKLKPQLRTHIENWTSQLRRQNMNRTLELLERCVTLSAVAL